MRKVVIFLSVLFYSEFSIAAGWSADLTVDKIFTEGASDIIAIYTSGGTEYTSGCVPNVWNFSASDDARRSRAYSTAMAALASGKKIRLWYSDACGPWNWHSATSIMLLK